mmetsp:Transcript_20625/g.43712  ORF Transcript_20625/g.43712 Transcript_20625/m.43712 type:complete len:302 (-) Transcript_20625:536-1441(-)
MVLSVEGGRGRSVIVGRGGVGIDVEGGRSVSLMDVAIHHQDSFDGAAVLSSIEFPQDRIILFRFRFRVIANVAIMAFGSPSHQSGNYRQIIQNGIPPPLLPRGVMRPPRQMTRHSVLERQLRRQDRPRHFRDGPLDEFRSTSLFPESDAAAVSFGQRAREEGAEEGGVDGRCQVGEGEGWEGERSEEVVFGEYQRSIIVGNGIVGRSVDFSFLLSVGHQKFIGILQYRMGRPTEFVHGKRVFFGPVGRRIIVVVHHGLMSSVLERIEADMTRREAVDEDIRKWFRSCFLEAGKLSSLICLP